MITETQKQELIKLSEPLIKFLNDNFHPHVHITITPISAELSEGISCHWTEEFIKD